MAAADNELWGGHEWRWEWQVFMLCPPVADAWRDFVVSETQVGHCDVGEYDAGLNKWRVPTVEIVTVSRDEDGVRPNVLR